MNKGFRADTPWLYLTSGAVSVALLMVLALLCLIGWRGLGYFWPAPIYQWEILEGDGQNYTLIGERHEIEGVPLQTLQESGLAFEQSEPLVARMLVKTGNREYMPLDFRWVWLPTVVSESTPRELALIQRRRNGHFYGRITQVEYNGSRYQGALALEWLPQAIRSANVLAERTTALQRDEMGSLHAQLEQLRIDLRQAQMQQQLTPELAAEIASEQAWLQQQYNEREQELAQLRSQAGRDHILVQDLRGELVQIPLAEVMNVIFPNAMGPLDKAWHWLAQIGAFVSDGPRDGNAEGGVFPAIFGTVLMVLLMAIIVTPLGVVAAIYLHEYAANNVLTRMIRVAVINLAGVPSIVYGVFGLGFFVYMLGGSIDKLFYADALPTPTFGTPGILWSALTLAILTLPVVIVSTEEGLARIPQSVRHGSLALGATKIETLWRIVLPMASPAILTGLILALARAAGEVAPLMLVGVVKLAPQLPIDGSFPFLHLERKFMHLGFHIYDVGFQSPHVEAARPLVYATSFLLLLVIVTLNLTAIGIRNRLRLRYRHLEQ